MLLYLTYTDFRSCRVSLRLQNSCMRCNYEGKRRFLSQSDAKPDKFFLRLEIAPRSYWELWLVQCDKRHVTLDQLWFSTTKRQNYSIFFIFAKLLNLYIALPVLTKSLQLIIRYWLQTLNLIVKLPFLYPLCVKFIAGPSTTELDQSYPFRVDSRERECGKVVTSSF